MNRSWYVVAKSRDLCKTPKRVWVNDRPLVLFRDDQGKAAALWDRCPHRGAPLSKGDVQGGCIRCPYHGWEFEANGQCRRIPGMPKDQVMQGVGVQAYACRESGGWIWVFPHQEEAPPLPIVPGLGEAGMVHRFLEAELETTLDRVAENLLDATHTHYVHSGLIRTEDKRKRVAATVRSIPHGVEAEYHEGKQAGWIMRLVSGGCEEIISYGRFLLPSIAQLEYRTEKKWQAYVTACLTPTQKGRVKAHLVISYRWGWVGRWLGRLIQPLFLIALRQDLRVLRWQTGNLREESDPSFLSSPTDLLGPKIRALLQAQALGKPLPSWETKRQELWL